MKNKDFGIWFAELREKNGYKSQRALSTKAGVANSTIARIESGTQIPEPDTLKKIAPLLGIAYEELLKAAGYLPNNNNTSLSNNEAETKAKELLDSTHPDIIALLKKVSDLSDEEKESIAEHWKWSVKVIEEERKRHKTRNSRAKRTTED